ncbi:MAG: SEC-C metal-binding domain-containing protein [Methylicorpusculum sp.]|nr:SEC-C metal-binding domain-containing protein [Methylicorpusculum sp.]MDO8940217.1 SEC-C metal-binding domain-containing protein [Methylicorpusculum sp.]MDP2201086.1 SEC-C metal-binding domain-containing protein [Methylicorpusculum sp.]
MKKLGRNDPCHCGSGKKYKQCCLKAEETQMASDRSEAVPKAINWFFTKYGQTAREALDEGFFGGLEDDEYALLQDLPGDSYQGIMINAMEWLLADGVITIKGQVHRVAELLFGRGGPLFSAEQRQWLEQLTTMPLRLYEIVDVRQGECMTLRDVMLPERQPVLVLEKSGSQHANRYDLIAARILPVKDHFELSGAVYSFPRHRSLDLLKELKSELEDVEPDSPLAKEINSVIIPYHWLELFLEAFEMPQLVDHVTGEPLLFVTDHYRVQDWDALDLALSAEADIEGNRDEGWSLIFEGDDGLTRRNLSIEVGKRQDRLKVFYRTQKYADEGRSWFEALAGSAIVFVSREISDPKGMLANLPPNEIKNTSEPAPLPPEFMTELIEKRIQQLYANWADESLPVLDDRTPREAIQTQEGLEQVKFLLHTYEHGEAQQAKAQHRAPVSYEFLWQSLGITP